MLLLVGSCMLSSFAIGQVGSNKVEEAPKVKKERRVRWLGLPVIFYTPETRWAFGAAAQATFRFRNEPDSSKPSTIRPGLVYTQNKQILFYVPFRLYWQNEDWLSFGEVGYYRYNFPFFGVGNGLPKQADLKEVFDVDFPRIRWYMMRKVAKSLYAGAHYAFDGMKITRVDSGGYLDRELYTGSNGGNISGLGLSSIYDTRDNIFYPSKGVYGETHLFYNTPILGGDFTYLRYTLDVAKFVEMPWKNHILAMHLFTETIAGDPPFYQMAQLGGAKRMRGYFEGLLRDKNVFLTQAEYRFPIAWRFAGAAFASYGLVAPTISDYALSNSQFTYGGGLRFSLDAKEKINIRADYGVGKHGGNFYVTVGEAF